MATVLYITANPGNESTSMGLTVGNAFVEAYRASHPQDEVVHIDLYKEYIPQVDADVFSGWGKLQSGGAFDTLTADEQKKVTRFGELTDQFVAADKYVFVTPMWNFSFPPVFKAYIDTICTAGKTFRYTEQGPVGLLTDKKVLHIEACGGIYSHGPAAEVEMGHRYVKSVMGFLGVPSIEAIFVEGHAMMPDKAGEIKSKAIEQAREVAKNF